MSKRALLSDKLEICDLAEVTSISTAKPRGSQTLLRGFDILDALTLESRSLRNLAQSVGLTRATTYRLASALLERGYLSHENGGGYCLGPRLLELKECAERQIDLVALAGDALRDIARRTGDTAHLAILDEGTVLYLGKAEGHRRLHVTSRLGERHDVARTALGKALLLDRSEQMWRAAHALSRDVPDWEVWKTQMRSYVSMGHAFDTDGEPDVRSLASPIRDVSGKIVAAIGVTSLACYCSEGWSAEMASFLKPRTSIISVEMGWNGET